MPIRMHGADWYHLYEERPEEPKHTLKVLVIDPTDASFGVDEARRFAERIVNLPEARWVAAEAPRNLAPASWVEREGPDVDRHLESRTLDEPTDKAFDQLIGELLARHLDRGRPLWRLTFVDGLVEGRVALVLALHHALADGTASARVISAVVDGGEAAEGVLDRDARDEPDPRHPILDDLAKITGHHARQVVTLPGLVGRSISSGMRVLRHRRATGASPPRRFDCPSTRFAAPLVEGRTYAHTEVDLDDFKAVRTAHQATVNDVYLAVVGRAVHRFLAELGEEPDGRFVVNVPVSVRSDSDRTRHGNFMRNWNVGLASDEPDPVERLRNIRAATEALRAEREVIDERLLRDWFGRYGMMRHVTRTLVDVEMNRTGRTPMNFVAANVAGPRESLTVFGAPVIGLHSASILIPHHALNVTAWSYQDQVSIGFTSCPGVVDDLHPLADLARDELAALVATTSTL